MACRRVRIFSSHPIALAQFRRLLCSDKAFQVVEGEDHCEMGVFDSELPSLDAILNLAILQNPLLRPLLVTSDCSDSICLHWLMRGMWGIVSYERYEEELCQALRSLAHGQLWVPASAITQYLRFEKGNRFPSVSFNLTEREREILGLLLRRLSNKEIAAILRISLRTVKFHVGNILNKLQATSRKDLSAISSAAWPMSSPVLPVPQTVP